MINLKPWKFQDLVTGIRITITEGKGLNVIHLDLPDELPKVRNRDFYFDKEGKFDGTGSSVNDQPLN